MSLGVMFKQLIWHELMAFVNGWVVIYHYGMYSLSLLVKCSLCTHTQILSISHWKLSIFLFA